MTRAMNMSARRSFRRLGKDASGTAALEFGLLAPVLLLIVVIVVDLGISLYQWQQVVSAVSAGGQFALLAGQHGTAATAIATETATVVQSSSNALLTANSVTVTANNGQSPTGTCCLSTSGAGLTRSWTCSTTPPVCADGSTPGVYIEINASYSVTPLIPSAALSGASLKSDLIERVR